MLGAIYLLVSPGLQTPHPLPGKPKLKPVYSAEQIERMSGDLSRKIESIRQATRAPGIEVAIVKDNKVVFLKAFGYRDLEKKLPMTVDTQTMIASCSKAFNATLVMLAADEGKLDLNARPSQYLPYFKLKDPEANQKMTVWDLMNHDSGLPRTDTFGFTYGLTSDEWIQSIGEAEPTFKFRENEQYSNVLVHTAGMIAAKAFGIPWAQAVKEKIFDPLGMTHSSAARYDTVPQMATGYDVDIDGSVRKVPYMEIESWGVAAGGIKSTASDMAKWLIVQLNHGQLDGRQVIPADVIDREHQPRMAQNGPSEVASGWFINHATGEDVIGHNGALEGFLTAVDLIPGRNLGIAVLTNSHGSGQAATMNYLMGELLGDSGVAPVQAYDMGRRGLYTDPSHTDFERISMVGETNSLGINRLGEPKVRLNRIEDPTLKSHVYVTADPRNRQVKVTFQKKGFDLTEGEKTTHFEFATEADGAISTKELQAKVIDAYGGRKALAETKYIAADVASQYVNEGLSSISHLYYRMPNDVAQFETYYGFGKKLGSSQWGNTRYRTTFAATFLESQHSAPFEPPVTSNAMRICDAPDWKTRFQYVRVVGSTTFNGEPVYVVLKHPKFPTKALDVYDYVSKNSFLTLRRELGPLDAPEDYSQSFNFSKFITVGGIKFPSIQTWIDNTEHKVIMRMSHVRAVDYIPNVAFHPGEFPGVESKAVGFR